MPAPLNMSTANVTGPDGTVWEKVGATSMRDGSRFVIRNAQGDTILEVEGVTAVRRQVRQGNTFAVETSAGVFTVTSVRRPCGCGR